MVIEPAVTGEPGKAPASYSSCASAAFSNPSFVQPIFTRMREPEVGPVARNTSSRDITILTGRPVFRASSVAVGSRYTVVLPPKPPPISAGMTRIWARSIPSTLAV